MQSKTSQFDTAVGTAAAAHMTLYIGAGSQPATVVVELPGIPGAATFPRTVNIPANSVVTVGGFPVGNPADATNAAGMPDCRLYYTGISNRGIHIYSTNGVPVSCWLYDWATDNSAAGAMLFPTNTWNSSYVVQAVGGTTNENAPNSFFFVIAAQDSTPITFTPSATIIDSASNPVSVTPNGGTNPYTTTSIVLNKGQVFNAMGLVNSSGLGLDLSGTTVSTVCTKKIAVFGGNGRCLIGTVGDNPTTGSNCNPGSGSDNLVQQMFPKVAWGTEYLTVPTKSMADNVFRVYVQNPATNVWLNKPIGTVLTTANALPKTSLINNLYYQFDNYSSCKIQSDIPVSVTQFITSGACGANGTYGNNGGGDPEMITLSPVQQSINSTAVYSSPFENGSTSGASYINVVVKGLGGVNSFKLDGQTTGIDTGSSNFTGTAYATVPLITMPKAFKQEPFDTNYYSAVFLVSYPGVHTLSSDSGFNAYAYGVVGGESYGYNAGTAIKNLSAATAVCNPYGCTPTAAGVTVQTCINNPATLSIGLPYPPGEVSTLTWDPGNNPNITPLGAVTVTATYTSKFVQNGDTFYVYTAPQPYVFSNYGTYSIKVTANGTFASDCPGVSNNTIYVYVGSDNVAFTATPAGCGSKNVTFTDSSTALTGTYITQWQWSFGDNTTFTSTDSTARNPVPDPHTYPALSSYTAKLTTINNIGCFSSDSIVLNLAFGLVGHFTFTPSDTICSGTTVAFTDSTYSNNGNTASSWSWDFGDGTTSTLQNPTHQYTNTTATVQTYKVKFISYTSSGCPSSEADTNIVVEPAPVANFTPPAGVCLPGSSAFTNTSTVGNTGSLPLTYLWTFVDNHTNGTTNPPSTVTTVNASYSYDGAPSATLYPNGYPVTLVATSRYGCASTVTTKYITNVYPAPVASFSVSSQSICDSTTVSFTDASTATNQTISSRYWIYGDGQVLTGNNTAPSHQYDSVGTFGARLVISTQQGCVSDTTAATNITVNPIPIASFSLPSSCLSSSGSAVTFTNASTVSDNSTLSYSWNFGDATSGSNTSTATNGQHIFTSAQTYNVNLTATSLAGCSNTKAEAYTIVGSQPAANIAVATNPVCSDSIIRIADNTTIAVGSIKSVDIWWDTVGAPNTYVSLSPAINYTNNYNLNANTGATYIIKIKEYADAGKTCYGQTSQTVTINPLPTVGFTLPSSCLSSSGSAVTFTDTSSIAQSPAGTTQSLSSYAWNFGDPTSGSNTSTAANGQHAFTSAQAYNVKLTATSSNGCSNSATEAYTIVGSQPTASIAVATNPVCSDSIIRIADNTTIAVGSIKSVDIWWDMVGAPNTYVSLSPAINYTNNYNLNVNTGATYTIQIKEYADAAKTCYGETSQTVTINPLPTVSFTMPSSCLSSNPSIFTNTSSIAQSPAGTTQSLSSYAWNFGDATSGSNTSTSANGQHVFTNVQTYNVKLVATSNHGCSDSATNAYTVVGSQPTANFTVKSNPVCSNLPVTITDNSTITTGSIKAVDIWWDDVNAPNTPASPEPSPAATYTNSYTALNANATYTIKLREYADAAKSCYGDYSLPVIVNGTPSVVWGTIPGICPNAAAVTINEATQPSGLSGSFSYSGTGVSGNTFNPALTPGAGNYPITALYTTVAGCKDSATGTITVYPSPTADFSYGTTRCEGTAISFNSGLSTTNVAGLSITGYAWNFGDGVGTSTANNPSYTYSTYSPVAGDTVKLTVTGSNNCVSATKYHVIDVNPLPNVSATMPTSICLPDATKTFTDATTFPIGTTISQSKVSWKWTFWDGTTSNLENPPYTFNDPILSSYPVTLTVTSAAGCSATGSFSVPTTSVHDQGAAPDFSVTPSLDVCFNTQMTFTDNSGGSQEYYWYYGDGNTDSSSALTANYTYSETGTWTVTHTVKDQNSGCMSQPYSKTVTVNPIPVITQMPTVYVVLGDSALLSPTVSGTNLSYRWSPNMDIRPDNTATVECTPLADQEYTVNVTAKGDCPAIPMSFDVVVLRPVDSIPNAFSPNGDGINDKWIIPYLSSYPYATVQIFDRNGMLVFNTYGYNTAWDGTYNGKALPIGTYYYVIKLGQGLPTKTGYVVLLR